MFSITAENFSWSNEIFQDFLKYLSVFEGCFTGKNKLILSEKFSRNSGKLSMSNEIYPHYLRY